VLESIQAMSLLTILEIVGPVVLLAVLIYGTLQWSRRRRGTTQAVREASTRELYREGARAEKRDEAGEASAEGAPTSQPPRPR
jgi:FtsZ-interacting cell division protein ZipA